MDTNQHINLVKIRLWIKQRSKDFLYNLDTWHLILSMELKLQNYILRNKLHTLHRKQNFIMCSKSSIEIWTRNHQNKTTKKRGFDWRLLRFVLVKEILTGNLNRADEWFFLRNGLMVWKIFRTKHVFLHVLFLKNFRNQRSIRFGEKL